MQLDPPNTLRGFVSYAVIILGLIAIGYYFVVWLGLPIPPIIWNVAAVALVVMFVVWVISILPKS